MKILFVNNFRGRGGGEEFLRDLLPGLSKKGVKVGLVCRPNTPLEAMFRGTDVEVHPVDRSGVRALTSLIKIARIIRSAGYGIVAIQRSHDVIQSWAAALLSFARPALVYTTQVPEFLRSRFFLDRIHAITTISRYIRDKMVSFYPGVSRNIAILYYGIDLEKFRPEKAQKGALRARFSLPHGTKIIGTVGDLWKNQIEFLDALAEIKKEFPGVRYAMVASESGIGQIETFRQRASELGLADSVLWAGRLDKEEMLSFYADIDLAVSTHRNEGFGIWVLEALAMGKPVVAFNAGGVRDSLDNCPAGTLVDNGAKEMAAEIVSIFRDEARYRRMSGAARPWVVERFGRERMTEDYYRFFQSVGHLEASKNGKA